MSDCLNFFDELSQPYQLQAFYSYLYLLGYADEITEHIFSKLDDFINANHTIVDEDGQIFSIDWENRDGLWEYDSYDELTIVESILSAPMDVYGDRAVFEVDPEPIYNLYSATVLDLDPSEADVACNSVGSLWRHRFDAAFDEALEKLKPEFLENVKGSLCFYDNGFFCQEELSHNELMDMLQIKIDEGDDDFFYWQRDNLCDCISRLGYEGDPDDCIEACLAGVPLQDILV